MIATLNDNAQRNMNINEWRNHCLKSLKANDVEINVLPSGAMKLKGRGADIVICDIGALSADDLSRLTRGRA